MVPIRIELDDTPRVDGNEHQSSLFSGFSFESAAFVEWPMQIFAPVDWDAGSHGWRQMLRLWNSSGDSGPELSFDKSASPERLFSLAREYAIAIRDFKKFFRRRGKFIRQPHDDKKNFRRAKEEKKGKEERRCFKCGDLNHFIIDCPQHSFNDQKAFVGGFWSDSEEEDDSKKDEICLMALENNEVLSDTLYYSSS
ncbi:zf-CCHC domain-containing protein [Tanacetum coccineum]